MMGCTRLTTDYCTNTTRVCRDRDTEAQLRGSLGYARSCHQSVPRPCRHLSGAQQPVQNAQFLGSGLLLNDSALLPHHVSDRHTRVAQETGRHKTSQAMKSIGCEHCVSWSVACY